MKTKQLIPFVAGLVISLSLIFVLTPVAVHAATITWDGGGSDANMQTAENWVGDVAPTENDSLVFPAGATQMAVLNDYPGNTSFGNITFSGPGTDNNPYIITGNAITLTSGMTCTDSQTGVAAMDITLSASQALQTGSNCVLIIGMDGESHSLSLSNHTLSINAPGLIFVYSSVSGSGNITVTGSDSKASLMVANSYTGETTVEAGNYLYVNDDLGMGSSAGGTTVQDGATLVLAKEDSDMNIAEPITIAGSGVLSTGSYTAYSGSAVFGYGDTESGTSQNRVLTLAGTLTLGGNVGFGLYGTGNTIRISGPITGNYSIYLLKGISKTNKLEISSSSNGSKTPNGTHYSEKSTVTLTDSRPSDSVSVGDNRDYIINGVRGTVTVLSDGILKGTGTVGALSVLSGGKVAPGLSPGCLISGNLTYNSGSVHEAELGGVEACTGYDQMQVTGTVSLGSATLTTLLYNDYAPAAGATYTIISNDGTDAITGTFNNLAEGATLTIGGAVVRISYVGGDGNDVVLTVVSAPGVPNTGFMLHTNNPVTILGASTLAAGSLLAVSRRGGRKYSARRR